MPTINLDLNYFDHLKTTRLKARLGPTADVYPIRLWAYCGRHHPEDGKLEGYTATEIELACEYSGNPGELVSGLEDLGFLRKTSEGWAINNWLARQGHLTRYHERAKTAAHRRWNKQSDATSNATSIANVALSKSPVQCSAVHSSAVHNTKIYTSPKSPKFDFDSVWQTYPSKTGRKLAERHFRASVKTPQDWQDIQTALGNYLKSKRVRDGFIQNGSTWFNDWQGWITPEGGANGAHGSTSAISYRDKLRQQKALEAAREDVAAGAVSAGIRDLPAIQDQTGASE